MFTFIETRLFSRLRERYLSDDEYARVQSALIENPEVGDNEEENIPAHILRKIKEEIDG